MTIYFSYDHNGYELTQNLIKNLNQKGFLAVDLISNYDKDDDYPLAAEILAKKIQQEPDSFGIAICGSGQGIAMALNRFDWIRAAAKVVDVDTVQKVRLHNHANCITFGAWDLKMDKALELILTFLKTEPDKANRHVRRVKQMSSK